MSGIHYYYSSPQRTHTRTCSRPLQPTGTPPALGECPAPWRLPCRRHQPHRRALRPAQALHHTPLAAGQEIVAASASAASGAGPRTGGFLMARTCRFGSSRWAQRAQREFLAVGPSFPRKQAGRVYTYQSVVAVELCVGNSRGLPRQSACAATPPQVCGHSCARSKLDEASTLVDSALPRPCAPEEWACAAGWPAAGCQWTGMGCRAEEQEEPPAPATQSPPPS
jgi:hypothetical protein